MNNVSTPSPAVPPVDSPKFLRDIEVTDLDALDLGNLARSLFHGIQIADLPFRIALFGPWGSGKSTVLNRVQQLLDESPSPRTRILWFNPWGYGSDNDLLHNLVLSIADLIPEKSRQSNKGSRVIQAALEALKALRPHLGGPALPPPNARDTTALDEQMPRASDRLRSLRNAFHDLVEAALGHNAERLVLFIDDLDKCVADTALAFIEGCKLFFSSHSRLVAVFALDHEVIANAVALKYGQRRRFDPERYIEKVFEFSYQVPPIFWHQLDRLVESFYHRVHLGAGLDEATQHVHTLAIIRTLHRPGLVLTPRSLKHIFNRFIWFFTARSWLPQAKESNIDLWLTWLLVSENWRAFRDHVSRHGVELLGEVCNRVTGNLLFPHSNDAARAALDGLSGQRALLDYFRHLFASIGDIHVPETQALLRGILQELVEINRTLRAHGI